MVDNTQLINRLAEFLPAESIIHEQEALRPYECDGLPAYRQLPLLAVLPDTTEQVQQVMRVCHEMQVPVVARGAATGLSGGALPLGDGILLGLSKFNRMIEINR
jgi:glycolate oxidase